MWIFAAAVLFPQGVGWFKSVTKRRPELVVVTDWSSLSCMELTSVSCPFSAIVDHVGVTIFMWGMHHKLIEFPENNCSIIL